MNKVSMFYSNQKPVDDIDVSVPCIVFLSGLRSDTPKGLSKHCLNKIDIMLRDLGVCANVCGNIHDLSLINDKLADKLNDINDKFFPKCKNVFVFGFQLFVPGFFKRYVKCMFEKIILPRIVDKDCKALPTDVIKKNLRNVVFFVHCYGAKIFFYMDKMLTQKLIELNYSSDQVNEIQKQMVVIAESPSWMFNNLKSTFVNFISLADKTLPYDKLYESNCYVNFIEEYNIVATQSMYKHRKLFNKNIEHIMWSLVEQSSMTEQGKQTINILKTVFYRALTLPYIENVQSLLKNCEIEKNIKQQPMLKIIEKIPTVKMKNFVFVTMALMNRVLNKSGTTCR